MINGWRILIGHSCEIDGVIFSDDFPSPFVQQTGTQIVRNRVSSLVTVISPTVNIGDVTIPTAVEIRQEIDSNSTRLSQLVTNTSSIADVSDIPTASQNAAAVRAELAPELELINTTVPMIDVKINALPVGVAGQVVADLQTEIANINTIPSLHTKVDDLPLSVREEMSTELSHLMTLQNGEGLDSTQAMMLLEMYRLYGLDPTKPLVVNMTSTTSGIREVEGISQLVQVTGSMTTVTRTQ
jgi:hypothetical protein